ncbi:DUF6158 family protein [Nocardioides sp. 1609]|uniref:DUF6158 family protein n=1 Tax=Nocardioides sp. 1609 TaxID=2508327 RepID=UPI00106FE41A|nr:DUF6158 family protein [Nocardioides sp. 1609]
MTATSAVDQLGRPAHELTDLELEQQGTQAHATRNWVFLHGSAEQFATHTARMLELEQEYLQRYPKRTWQGSGGAVSEETQLQVVQQALRNIMQQLQALLEHPPRAESASEEDDPQRSLLGRVAATPGGRMNKLELHQVAREVGLDRTALARLYSAEPPLLRTDLQDRVITRAGRDQLL